MKSDSATNQVDEHIKIMIAAAPMAICVYDSDYTFIDCNETAARMLNFKDKESLIEEIRKDFFTISSEYQADGARSTEKFRQVFQQATLEGRAQFEWLHITKDGDELPVDVTLSHVKHLDLPIFVSYVQDLRYIREAERQRIAAEIAVSRLEKQYLLSNQVHLNGCVLNLTNIEFKLLYLCIQNEGKIIRFEKIYEAIWQHPMVGDKSAVRVAVKRFRQKIEPAGYDICAVRGKGYVFEKN